MVRWMLGVICCLLLYCCVLSLCAGIKPVLPAAAEARCSAAHEDQPGFEKVSIFWTVFLFFQGQQITSCLCCVRPKGCNVNRYFTCMRRRLFLLCEIHTVHYGIFLWCTVSIKPVVSAASVCHGRWTADLYH